MHRFGGLLAAFIAVAFLQSTAFLQPARADEFLLRSGGHIEGDLLNADQSPRTSYVIAIPGGGQITLDAAVVEQVKSPRPELAEYEKMRRKAPDTVDGQMKLAEWCKEQGLKAQRKTALERVVVLDPDQPEARRMLGYRKIKDQWMTHDEEMADKGYVKRAVNGETRWVTPQEAQNSETKDRQNKLEALWRRNITTWRRWMDSKDGNRAENGKNNLQGIQDAAAIGPLGERLNGHRSLNVGMDLNNDARLIYVEVLGRFNAHEARGPLAIAAIDDPFEEVRLQCLDQLEKQKDDAVTKYFEHRMTDKYASDDTIDRAGVALGRIKDPSSVAVLVKYVAYERTEVIPNSGGGPGSMTSSFNKNGGPGGGLSMNAKPKTYQRQVQCRGVLDALVAITGQNFGYDSRAWQTWYRNQTSSGAPIGKKQ
jgi:hypothetical protein